MSRTTSLPETVLITGASSGIGLELAHAFARRRHPLVLVAPVAAELQGVAGQLRTEHSVEVHAIPQDLRAPAAAQRIAAGVSGLGLEVDILVNNAGLGHRGHFWEIPATDESDMLRVNVDAPLALTRQFLPAMLARGHGRILNTASIAGFEPGPMLAVYHATKAFILSLSEALATELHDFHVTVTALCPGPVDTDFFPKAGMLATRAFQQAKVMGPREVAEAGVAATLKGDRVVVPGAVNKVSVFARRLLPEGAKAFKNATLYEEVPPTRRTRARGDVERKESARPRPARRR